MAAENTTTLFTFRSAFGALVNAGRYGSRGGAGIRDYVGWTCFLTGSSSFLLADAADTFAWCVVPPAAAMFWSCVDIFRCSAGLVSILPFTHSDLSFVLCFQFLPFVLSSFALFLSPFSFVSSIIAYSCTTLLNSNNRTTSLAHLHQSLSLYLSASSVFSTATVAIMVTHNHDKVIRFFLVAHRPPLLLHQLEAAHISRVLSSRKSAFVRFCLMYCSYCITCLLIFREHCRCRGIVSIIS